MYGQYLFARGDSMNSAKGNQSLSQCGHAKLIFAFHPGCDC